MKVSEETVFPSREREVGHGCGNSEVDADVAGSNLMPKLARRVAAAGKQAGHVAVGGPVHNLYGFFERSRTNDAEHRPEHFCACKRAGGIHVGQYSRFEEVSAFAA